MTSVTGNSMLSLTQTAMTTVSSLLQSPISSCAVHQPSTPGRFERSVHPIDKWFCMSC